MKCSDDSVVSLTEIQNRGKNLGEKLNLILSMKNLINLRGTQAGIFNKQTNFQTSWNCLRWTWMWIVTSIEMAGKITRMYEWILENLQWPTSEKGWRNCRLRGEQKESMASCQEEVSRKTDWPLPYWSLVRNEVKSVCMIWQLGDVRNQSLSICNRALGRHWLDGGREKKRKEVNLRFPFYKFGWENSVRIRGKHRIKEGNFFPLGMEKSNDSEGEEATRE